MVIFLKNMRTLILALLLCSCNTKLCSDLPPFTSYSQAISEIKKATFSFTESIYIGKSSWIHSASYYTCDHVTGFLIISTDGGEYVHSGLPMTVWVAFKSEGSYGSYYDANIKGKYRLMLKD